MTRTTQLLEALAALVEVTDDTAKQLEAESPGLAECGYWSDQQKFAFDNAKGIVAAANVGKDAQEKTRGLFNAMEQLCYNVASLDDAGMDVHAKSAIASARKLRTELQRHAE